MQQNHYMDLNEKLQIDSQTIAPSQRQNETHRCGLAAGTKNTLPNAAKCSQQKGYVRCEIRKCGSHQTTHKKNLRVGA